MRLSLGFIGRHLPFPVIDFSSPDREMRYGDVRWLLPNQQQFEPCVLYVTDRIPSEAMLESESGFVVVTGSIPDDVPFISAEVVVVDSKYSCEEVLSAISDLLRRYSGYELELSRLVYKPKGLAEICKLFFDILGCPACYTDSNFKVIAFYGDQDSSEACYVWSHVVKDGYFPYPEVQKLTGDDPEGWFDSQGRSAIVKSSETSFPVINKPIFLDDECQGFFFVHSILNNLGPDDVEIIDELGSYIADALLNDPLITMPKNLKYEQFCHGVIRGVISDRDLMRQKAASIGVDADGEFVIVLLETPRLNDYLSEYLLQELYSIKGCLPFLEVGGVKAIIQSPDTKGFSKAIERMESVASRFGCRLSASERFSGLWNARIYSTQADLAMRFDPELGFSGRCRFFEEVYFEALIGSFVDQSVQDPQVFINRSARLLVANEAVESFNCMDTLQAYVTCGYNSLQASRKLCIHRSTLNYRLRKISEICEFDIGDINALKRTSLSISLLMAVRNSASPQN